MTQSYTESWFGFLVILDLIKCCHGEIERGSRHLGSHLFNEAWVRKNQHAQHAGLNQQLPWRSHDCRSWKLSIKNKHTYKRELACSRWPAYSSEEPLRTCCSPVAADPWERRKSKPGVLIKLSAFTCITAGLLTWKGDAHKRCEHGFAVIVPENTWHNIN